jgi:hypothetical protein
MAAATMNAETKGKKARVRGKLPEKRSINMAVVGQKKTRLSTALLAVILILLVAAAVAKYAVMDRLEEVDRAEARVRDLRTQLSAANAKLDSFGELKEKYAHYTLADFTPEELKRVERSDVVDLIERIVLPAAEPNSWNVKQNQLTLEVTMDTLQDTNLLAQLLNEDDLVEFSTVKNAVTVEIEKEEPPVEELPEGEEGAEGAEGSETGEAPAEGSETGEAPAEGGEPAEGEEEAQEPIYKVNAQIIAYLTVKEG